MENDIRYQMAQAERDISQKRMVELEMALGTSEQLREKAEREIAALMHDLMEAEWDSCDCKHCKHYATMNDRCEQADCDCAACEAQCVCRDCLENSNWEWRGVQDESLCGRVSV